MVQSAGTVSGGVAVAVLPDDAARPIPVTKTPAWPHQQAAFWRLLTERYAGLFMERGTGKSKVTVDLIVNRRHRFSLILCPSNMTLPTGWPRQFATHAGRPVRVLALGPQYASVKAKLDALQQAIVETGADEQIVVVLNYESAVQPAMAAFLLSRRWDLVALDEAHRIKAADSKISQFCAKLRDRAVFRLALTATPMGQHPLDVFGIYRFLDPKIFGTNHDRFEERYAVCKVMAGIRTLRDWGGKVIDGTAYGPITEGELARVVMNGQQTRLRVSAIQREGKHFIARLEDGNGIQITGGFVQIAGVKNEDELHAKVFSCAVYVPRDVLGLLPPIHDIRTCQLSPAGTRHYREMEKWLFTEVDRGEVTAANAAVKLLRLQQVTSGFLKTDDGEIERVDDAKAKLLAEVLDKLPPGEPVVVFGVFHEDLDRIREVAEEQGRPCLEVSGRRNHLARWQSGEAEVLVAQPASVAEGVDLTRARHNIYYSMDYSRIRFEQSQARSDRPLQDGAVRQESTVFTYLFAEGLADQRVYEALLERKSVVDAVMLLRQEQPPRGGGGRRDQRQERGRNAA